MTPGEAARTVQKALTANGYQADRTSAIAIGDFVLVEGEFSTIMAKPLGYFAAVVHGDEHFTITAGAFGTITQDGADPFTDL